jgi:hypothetical protein
MVTKKMIFGTLLIATGIYANINAADTGCVHALFIENKSDIALTIMYTTREGLRVEEPMLQGEQFKKLICVDQLRSVAFARRVTGAREIALDDQLDTIRQDAHAPCLRGKVPVITIAAVPGGWSTTVEWHVHVEAPIVTRPALPG